MQKFTISYSNLLGQIETETFFGNEYTANFRGNWKSAKLQGNSFFPINFEVSQVEAPQVVTGETVTALQVETVTA